MRYFASLATNGLVESRLLQLARRCGWASFWFFFVKGLVWLAVSYAVISVT